MDIVSNPYGRLQRACPVLHGIRLKRPLQS
jgi:hypothetical protein